MIGLIVGLVILGGLVTWLRFSVWRVKPGEIGVRTILGSLDGHICRPGFHFVPKFFECRLLKVSPQCKIDFAAIDVYTKATPSCESEALSVAITLYMRFPVDGRLRDIIQSGMPTSQEGLLKHFDPVVSEETKTVFGELTWRRAVTQVQTVKQRIENGLVLQGLFTDFAANGGSFDIVVETIELPDKLKQALSYHDQMKINAIAAESIAKGRAAIVFQGHLERIRQATGLSPEKMREEINHNNALKQRISNISLNMTQSEAFIGGQFFDGQNLVHFNATGSAQRDRGLSALATTINRALQRGGTRQSGQRDRGVPPNFKIEDVEVI